MLRVPHRRFAAGPDLSERIGSMDVHDVVVKVKGRRRRGGRGTRGGVAGQHDHEHDMALSWVLT